MKTRSNSVREASPLATMRPTPPLRSQVAATGVTATSYSVTLSWSASTSSGVTGYNVYLGRYRAPVLGDTYADKAVKTGAQYYYVVTAVTSSGLESAHSRQT